MKISLHTSLSRLAAITISLFAATVSLAEPVPGQPEALKVRLQPRSPEQMTAFYEARGFPVAMLKPLAKTCYITVGIRNNSDDTVWLDLSLWQFSAGDKPLHRYHRREWLQRWQTMGMPLRFQSTFRWTLIPELLDYQPGEEEGGNIILQRTNKPIHITAVFPTGQDKSGNPVKLTFDNIRCAEDIQ